MAKIYAKQIGLGAITLDKVPAKWHKEVEKLLAEQTDTNETAAE